MSLWKYILRRIERGENILDHEVYRDCGEVSLVTVEEYKDRAYRLVWARKEYDGKDIDFITHIQRTYALHIVGDDEHTLHRIPKDYFIELKKRGVRVR